MRVRFLLLSLALVAGCTKAPVDDSESRKGRTATTPEQALPTDHVEPNTLAPGTEKAYALILPLGFKVTTRLDRTTAAVGMAQPKLVVNFIKERVRDGKLVEGRDETERTVFEGVRIPDEPDRYLQVIVTPRPGSTLITVTDVTEIPPLPPTSESERYRQVGLDPAGNLLHPRTME